MMSPRDKLGLMLGVIGVTIFAGSLPATRIAVATVSYTHLTLPTIYSV